MGENQGMIWLIVAVIAAGAAIIVLSSIMEKPLEPNNQTEFADSANMQVE